MSGRWPQDPQISVVGSSAGDARIHRIGPSDGPVLALGHGAGGGVDSADLVLVAEAAASCGWQVVLVEQPWRVAGRKVAAPPSHLDRAWVEALATIDGPVVVSGGRSAGARVACRTAVELGVSGVLALAFPLHPPGSPERSRASELLGVEVEALVVQGTRDVFGSAGEVAAACASSRVIDVCPVEGADHALRVPARSSSPGLRGALPRIEGFLGSIVGN